MSLGLCKQTFGGINENYGKISGRRPRRHVPRVLFMPRGVRDDESPSCRSKIPIRDVDCDSLLALGAQSVRQQREVDQAVRSIDPALFQRSELIFVNAFCV